MLKRNNSIPLALAACVLLIGAGVSVALAENETTTSAATEEPSTSTTAQKPVLDGAKVYAWNCGSCHSERWPKERSDAEWDVITTHMRVRASMTAAQTRAVLRYLKDNN